MVAPPPRLREKATRPHLDAGAFDQLTTSTASLTDASLSENARLREAAQCKLRIQKIAKATRAADLAFIRGQLTPRPEQISKAEG